jgi:DNA-binding transcriptional LysR family regulator
VLTEVRRARDEAEQLHGGTSGKVVAGLSLAAHIALLPKALAPFRARYPHVELHLIEGWYPTLEAGLKDGSVDFYVGPRPDQEPSPELTQETLFENVRIILARKNHPRAGARSLRDLAGVEWATTSVTFRAEEELGQLFAQHHMPPPRLALRSQSALTLMIALACSDLLAMVPIQWIDFSETSDTLAPIPLKETLPAPPIVTVRRAGLPLTPAAEFLLDLLRRHLPQPQRAPKVASRYSSAKA